MRLRSFRLTGAYLCLLLAVAPARADLLLSGASTILPVVEHAAEEFTAKTGIRVRVVGGGSAVGIKRVINGSAHIGMVSRDLHVDGNERHQLRAHTVGFDGIAVFVNERNGLGGLAHAQVADVYAGRINRWRELSAEGADDRIVRVGKLHGRATRELFDDFFGLSGQEYPVETQMIGANVAAILHVSIDPSSIGYVSIGSLNHARRRGAPVKPLSIDGVLPTAANLASGRYPYRRPLNLVTRGAPGGEALRFIEWMKGAAGQRTVLAMGFLPATEGH